ncbi:vesicle-associated protein 1-2 [Selaginella moellendorffii]|uniref:vesicle-associated protein 1-2 n=1 Tax=Selaginella moellendorffii TaxID=88036 RepID=UPI000D1C2329|nr:vesicle-associated protein 1-2 [Selaginella moellendorffii]|eukprot:XP_024524990.1 vesicle-associated protein 1-2 [Selaginella moellendorffii]
MAVESASTDGAGLLRVEPRELQFPFELDRQLSCKLKLGNDTKHYVAFKVKTTSPKSFCVSPSTGVLQPRSALEISVTMRAQHRKPVDGQSKDKFLIQSVVAPDEFLASDINQEMFTKDLGNEIFETKMRVSFAFPAKETSNGAVPNSHDAGYLKEKIQEVNAALTTVSEERNAAVALSQRLQQELESLTANRNRSAAQNAGFSVLVVLLVALLGIVLGFLLGT